MMNSTENGQQNPESNVARSADGQENDRQILRALEVIHEPRSSNPVRRDASSYLDQVRSQDDAPYRGYFFSIDKSHPSIVRHFGLSLLEYAIRHRWSDYTREQSAALQDWAVKLAQSVSEQDPLFIRNKIAQLWVEIAKRSWALEWMDMDELLVQIWGGSIVLKELVLVILETLSDDSFGREEIMSSLRGTELNRACVEIFTPAHVLTENFPARDTSVNVRYGDEGWLMRISDFLSWTTNHSQANNDLNSCTVTTLTALRSVLGWAILGALTSTHCVQRICEAVLNPNERVQLAAIETLLVLYNRHRYSDDDVRNLVRPMFESATVEAFKKVYERSLVDVTDVDPDKYLLSKKFSEVVHNIGRFLDERPLLFAEHTDIAPFLDLLMTILHHQSLHVTIPIVHLWAKLLCSEHIGDTPPLMTHIAALLEVCSQRLLRYDALPSDSRMPSIIFLNEDVDTMPERHAFLGNYARFCNQIVQSIVAKQPFDALHYILSQADQVLDNLYQDEAVFNVRTYNKTTAPSLRLDAQFSVVEAALKGYVKWLNQHKSAQIESQQVSMNVDLQEWCTRLMGRSFEDPAVKQRIIQLMIEFGIGPLKHNSGFTLKVFNFTIETRAAAHPDATAYNESIKDLQVFCVHQLQRLAIRFANDLITKYEYVEQKIAEFCDACGLDETDRNRCSSILFIIVQRAVGLNDAQREEHLQRFLQPIVQKWQNEQLTNYLSTFQGFRDLLGLTDLQQYLISRKVNEIYEWAQQPLDAEGRELQSRIQNASDQLPLRSTRTFLSVSIEKTDPGSPPYRIACKLWSVLLPAILPNLLQFISNAHTFHDPASWTDLPPVMKSTIRRILTDRFWQVGISTGSRDDFYAKVDGTKSSLEGLASSVRASLRTVRETSYRLLLSMSALGKEIYMYDNFAESLAKALFSESCALSAHQNLMLIDTIYPVIVHCPSIRRSQFVAPMLAAMFTQLDQKVSTEWASIEERKVAAASAEEGLTEEMRDESVLRQLTYTSVMMVVQLMDPNKNHDTEGGNHTTTQPRLEGAAVDASLRTFILETPEVLKPLILFCTHALGMHDTRSCGFITRVLRSIIPEFNGSTSLDADVREFISTEVFKQCITSLHDPYFVDTQSDLASLIASILLQYGERTATPRQVLLSLPDMTADKVDHALLQLMRPQISQKQQRAVVLKFLENLRGVSISEQGRISKVVPKNARSALQEQYMTVDMEPHAKKEPSPELGGVAAMFG